MTKVSKEFVEAMNGVLNGEEWESNAGKLSFHPCVYSSMQEKPFRAIMDIITEEKMTATDWRRID